MSDYIFMPEDNVKEAECIEAYDNSIDFYLLVLKSFIKDSEKIMSNMQTFYDESDMEKYRITVHGLKSLSASVGFWIYQSMRWIRNIFARPWTGVL